MYQYHHLLSFRRLLNHPAVPARGWGKEKHSRIESTLYQTNWHSEGIAWSVWVTVHNKFIQVYFTDDKQAADVHMDHEKTSSFRKTVNNFEPVRSSHNWQSTQYGRRTSNQERAAKAYLPTCRYLRKYLHLHLHRQQYCPATPPKIPCKVQHKQHLCFSNRKKTGKVPRQPGSKRTSCAQEGKKSFATAGALLHQAWSLLPALGLNAELVPSNVHEERSQEIFLLASLVACISWSV